MSLFLYPTAAGPFETIASRQRQRNDRFLFTEEPVPSHRARRCVPFAQGYRPVSTSAQPYFDVTADDDGNVRDYQVQDLAAALRRQEQQVAYERHMAAQRRQQFELARRQQLERQRRILEQRHREQQQQQEAEQQALAAMAAAAASAWAMQVEEQQKRKAEHARRVALARHHQQQQQLHIEAQRREQARKAAYTAQKHALQQRESQRVDWEEQMRSLATHGLSSLVDIAGQFFADLIGPEAETETTPASQQDTEQSDAVPEQQVKTAEAAPVDDIMTYDDPAEVVPTSSTAQPSNAESPSVTKDVEIAAEDAAPAEKTSTQEQSQEQLVFTYPLPDDAAQRATVSAADINVAFDKQSHSLVVKGLWPTHAGLPGTSTSNERGRKCTRSPKRPRVTDVDETTGEEIERPAGDTAHATSDHDDDDFEHVDAASSAGSSASSTQHSTRSAAPEPVLVPLPAGADMSRLRADLTDDGLKIWI